MSCFFWSCWKSRSHRIQNILGYCGCPWLPIRIQQWDSIAKDATYLSHRTQQNQGGKDLEIYPKWLAFMVVEGTTQVSRVEKNNKSFLTMNF